MIGFAGAHRTGKTTLAKLSAEMLQMPFVETSTSEVFRQLGYDPAAPMDFQTRIMIQNVVLKSAIERWQGYKDGFLTDRTPMDMLAYTLADVANGTLDATAEALLEDYTHKCIKACNDYFSLIMLVQPGIPLVYEPGKASMSKGYMEHLNALMMGLMIRKDVEADVVYIRRDNIHPETRLRSVMFAYKNLMKRVFTERSEVAALH